MKNWFQIKKSEKVISPSLLIYPDRIKKNIEMMIAIAGGVQKLRPHIKTHKIKELVELKQSYGIQKFKCATIAEAELLGMCEVEDALLAMQPVGIQITRFFKLIKKYPKTKFSTIVDNEFTLNQLIRGAVNNNSKVSLWLDINNGMNRTGIKPNEIAKKLFMNMSKSDYVIAEGFHVYDGHIHISDVLEREKVCHQDFKSVLELKESLKQENIPVKTVVAGGSITFPIHAKREGVEVSPGTPIFWDAGYSKKYKDLKFLPAAVLFTRVVSNPTENTSCLDLGHKAIASEMAFPRVQFLGEMDISQIDQHEEHLVIENTKGFNIGDELYALPVHVCPTVAKYNSVQVVREKEISSVWKVAARDYQLEI